MATIRSEELANAELLSAENESNTNADGTTDEENLSTEYTVLVNGERITIYSDKWGASIQDKLEGHGIHIQKNGDIAILSGKGGKGNACGGRLLINTKNGQMIKSGPLVSEYIASSKDPGEGEGSETDTSSGNGEAISTVAYGDSTEEVLGDKYIKGNNITLDADTITIRAGTQIIVETGEWVEEIGTRKSNVNFLEEDLFKSETVVKEETTLQFDPRASKNVVSLGHLNHRVLGDYAVKVNGFFDLQVMGGNSFSKPLIKNRSAALTIGVNGLKNGGKFFVFTKGTFDLASGLGEKGDLFLSTLGNLEAESLAGNALLKAKTGAKIETIKGNLELKAIAGDVDIDALKIYLN